MSGTAATGIFISEIWSGLKINESSEETEHFRKLSPVTSFAIKQGICNSSVLNHSEKWLFKNPVHNKENKILKYL